jgi:DNA-binding SARP family transcriptional activator
MQFRILGPLEVLDGDRVLELPGLRQRSLLALLLLHANQAVSSDRLIEELWPEEPAASHAGALQVNVSRLRKSLGRGADLLATLPAGYTIRLDPGQLDLDRFERLVEDAGAAAPQEAAEKLREALRLWRGPPLADFAYEPFAQAAIGRLEELRLLAVELRIDADLALGRHSALVAELDALSVEHPLRERLRGQLMLALYRAGRQAEALAVFQDTRMALVEELGIEPGVGLQELERAILRQDPALEPAASTPIPDAWPERSIVVAPADDRNVEVLLALAEPLARSVPARELIVARLVPSEQLASATRSLHERCDALAGAGVAARAAAFTSADPGYDLVRLAADQAADLVLLDAPPAFLDDGMFTGPLGVVLDSASCDVGVLVARETLHLASDRPVLVPFGGAEHDWAAVELAAWIVRATGSSLRLVGREADLASGERDASRLLASASLLVQRAIRVPTEPLLVAPGRDGILDAAASARLLVFGLSDRWRREGLGETRLAIASDAPVPTLLVRKGLRPGGVAPDGTMTRFTWSLGATTGTTP